MRPITYEMAHFKPRTVKFINNGSCEEVRGLFTYCRVNNDTVPRGQYRYEIRENSGQRTIEYFVGVDFAGTFIAPKKIDIPECGYLELIHKNDFALERN